MIIDTKQIISMSEANQNFSKAVKTVDQYGKAVIMKNNKPKYIIIDVNQHLDITEDEKIVILAKRILIRHLQAFMELAK
ncbi:MAG: type II toxin-antitoxin system Phd/YefM family antitoxin [Roseburia sp.]|nr:type II toxin-antitoxin system Phd/YefM family antitoxin [Anaeroplasma bactoclasticum]MCM1196525.1 type II toxin-antitoxin system Phd/YefM family antitoxin [Roseburia sp.]MCM1557119.1 type II toxin-antitoxin system Phd/YefM family antitoxin [Anaeroplasma bactoclasticum]